MNPTNNTENPADIASESLPEDHNSVLLSCKVFNVLKTYQKGQSGQIHSRYIVRHSGGVGILPILPDGRIVLVRQFRMAAEKFIYEIPAGLKEPNEEPIETARRELIEETGYRTDDLTPFPTFFSSPGFLTERIALFMAENLTPGPSATEDGEILAPVIVDLPQAMKMIETGEIEDGKTIIALLYYQCHYAPKAS